MTQDTATNTLYRVVISQEERYSIWPDYKEIPWGWQATEKSGSKQECLDYIAATWTDMRPLSLRQHMNSVSAEADTAQAPESSTDHPL